MSEELRRKVVIGFSGGMDSTTLLAYYLQGGLEVHCCVFTYGSKHNVYEMEAVNRILMYYEKLMPDKIRGLKILHFDLREIFRGFKSNLLSSGGAIPEGHYESKEMEATKVPGRNLIMASIMAGVAENIGASFISLGVHAGDRTIYPDCRETFIIALNKTLFYSSDG